MSCLKVICWALIFIFKLRFPPGVSNATVTEVKDLDMLLDPRLTCDKHIQALSSSCISKLGQLGRVKHKFDQPTLATIIETLVISKINYCSTVWSNISDNIKKDSID